MKMPQEWTHELNATMRPDGSWSCEVRTTIGKLVAVVFASNEKKAVELAAFIAASPDVADVLIRYLISDSGPEMMDDLHMSGVSAVTKAGIKI